jgi:hypothetical protein
LELDLGVDEHSDVDDKAKEKQKGHHHHRHHERGLTLFILLIWPIWFAPELPVQVVNPLMFLQV